MTVLLNGAKYPESNIGNLEDLVKVPYVEGNSILAFLHTGYYHVHGASFLRPDKAVPVVLTSAAGAWDISGAKTEIIAANNITKDFDIHWISIYDISTALYGVIDIFAGGVGSEVLIGSVDIGRSASGSRETALPIMIPQQLANTRISARLTTNNAGAQTCGIKLIGHVYSKSLT